MENIPIVEVVSDREVSKKFSVSAHTFANLKRYNDKGDKVALNRLMTKLEEKLGIRKREDITNSAMELGKYCEPFIAQELANASNTKGYRFASNVCIIKDGVGGYMDLLKIKMSAEGIPDYTAPQNNIDEIKTITTSKRWAEVQKKADEDHMAQLAIYLYESGIKSGRVVYFNAAQKGEKNPTQSFAAKEALDYTLDKDSVNYKVYKLTLEGSKKLTATKIVEPYLIPGEGIKISIEDFKNWVKTQTLPTFYQSAFELENKEFWDQYDKNKDNIVVLKTQQANLQVELDKALEMGKMFEGEVLKILESQKIDLMITPNRILRQPAMKNVFDSTEFKKQHGKEYTACRVSSMKFDAKKVETTYPDLFKSFSTPKPDGRTSIISSRDEQR